MDHTDKSDTLFRIRRDHFRPAHLKKGGELTESNDDAITGDSVSSHDLLIFETFQKSYIHLSENITKTFSLVHGESVTSNVALSLKP